MSRHASPCDRHRRALVDFVDRGERGPATPEALDHLSICRRCEGELTEIALTIVALRRAGSEVRMVPVPAVPPERLARAILPRRDPWRWRLQLGSLIASTAIAALVVAPRVGVGPAAEGAGSLMPARPASAVTWRVAEARLAASPDSRPVAETGTLPPRYPDGLIRPRKEVLSTDATPRELDPS